MKENDSPAAYPILIAEDNPVSRSVLEKKLVQAGYEVISTENGQEALNTFQNRFFPIVLSDWLMPEMDGVALCQAIRKMKLPGYVFFILLTAKDSKDDVIKGLQSGADDYLTKPIIHAELMARIHTGIRILELEKSLRAANEEIKALSISDPLTGCYNRRYLNGHLPQEIKRAERYRRPFSVILCDIDHFKRINDTHGHLAGDLVLKCFVKWLTDSIRTAIDWLARFGGEEFLLALPETDFPSAMRAAERLRLAVASQTIELDNANIVITSSFGVTGINVDTPADRISMDRMISQADHYLYEAKNAGRNRVMGGSL